MPAALKKIEWSDDDAPVVDVVGSRPPLPNTHQGVLLSVDEKLYQPIDAESAAYENLAWDSEADVGSPGGWD